MSIAQIQWQFSENGLLSDFLKMVTYFQFRFLGKTYRITSLERKAFLNIKENQTVISRPILILSKVCYFHKIPFKTL